MLCRLNEDTQERQGRSVRRKPPPLLAALGVAFWPFQGGILLIISSDRPVLVPCCPFPSLFFRRSGAGRTGPFTLPVQIRPVSVPAGQCGGRGSPGSGISGNRTADTRTSLPPAAPERCEQPASPATTARPSCSSLSRGCPSRLALALPALLAKTLTVSDTSTFTGSPEPGGVPVAAPPAAVVRVLANSQEQKLRQPVPVCGHGLRFNRANLVI